MGVYIDTTRTPYGRMFMSHMIADSLNELHRMAKCIGIRRKWFQDKSVPHYDICQSKKVLALKKFGAHEIDRRTFVEIMQVIRKRRLR